MDSRRQELRSIHGKIARNTQRIEQLKKENRRLRRRASYLMHEPTSGRRFGGTQDSLYVPSNEVAEYVKDYLKFSGHGSQKHLAELAGVSMKTVIRVKKQVYPHTTFDVADRLFTAMGLEHRIKDLTVIDNPQMRHHEDNGD